MLCPLPAEVPHDLKEDTTSTPQVHLIVVVPTGEQALWGSVPARGDVLCVRGPGGHTQTQAEVTELQTVLLQNKCRNIYTSAAVVFLSSKL